MLSTILSRSCRQFGRGALSRANQIGGRARVQPRIHANSMSTQLSFPDILGESPEVAPVMEDAMDDDILGESELFQQQDHVEVRIQSPSSASYSSVEVESNPFDQDYDQYSLHMSTFQAYNTTHEDLPPELGNLEPEDVMNLEVVQNWWETHPNAYTDELPAVSGMAGEEFAPDVEDI